MNNKHYVGRKATSFQQYDKIGPVTGIALVVDEDHEYRAGDQDGYVLTVPCTYGSQDLADALLERARGKTYQGYSATNTTLDPLAELGDGITISGTYGVLATREVTFGGGHSSDISAPGEKMIRHRYSTENMASSKAIRRANRQNAETRATITKTSEEIRLEVSQTYATNEKLSSTIEQTATTIREEVKNTADGLQASITVNANAIEQRVTKNGIIAAINLTSEQATIQASKISLEGLVTVNKTFQIDTQGYLTCTGGKIGGFTITGSSLYNGLSTLAGTANGVYIGTDGISLGGGKFKVTSAGAMTASSATITGEVNATSGTFNKVTITGSTFGGTLSNATGSVSSITGSLNGVTGSYSGSINSGGTFSGTHSGGSLSGTGGTFYGGHYSNVVSSCNLGGTSLAMASGGGSYISQSSGGVLIAGSGVAQLSASSHSVTCNSTGVSVSGTLYVNGNLATTLFKSRIIPTKNFGTRCLDANETPLPTFSDYGTAALDDSGVCCICIDPIFAETVNPDYMPTVFLTPYGDGALWVDKVEHDIITVRGEPGMRFAWETRYAQTNAYVQRLRVMDFDLPDTSGEHDFDSEAAVYYEHHSPNLEISALDYLNSYNAAAIDYGAAGCEYYEEFERSLEAA